MNNTNLVIRPIKRPPKDKFTIISEDLTSSIASELFIKSDPGLKTIFEETEKGLYKIPYLWECIREDIIFPDDMWIIENYIKIFNGEMDPKLDNIIGIEKLERFDCNLYLFSKKILPNLEKVNKDPMSLIYRRTDFVFPELIKFLNCYKIEKKFKCHVTDFTETIYSVK